MTRIARNFTTKSTGQGHRPWSRDGARGRQRVSRLDRSRKRCFCRNQVTRPNYAATLRTSAGWRARDHGDFANGRKTCAPSHQRTAPHPAPGEAQRGRPQRACQPDQRVYGTDVTATDVIRQFESLPATEQAKVREWLHAHEVQETPAMLAALDAAARSADKRTTPLADVRKMLPTWISKSA